jgi:hypothetical protein
MAVVGWNEKWSFFFPLAWVPAWVLVGQKRKHHFSGQQVFCIILEVLHEHGAYDGVERVDGRPWGVVESGRKWSGVKGKKKCLLFWLEL